MTAPTICPGCESDIYPDDEPTVVGSLFHWHPRCYRRLRRIALMPPPDPRAVRAQFDRFLNALIRSYWDEPVAGRSAWIGKKIRPIKVAQAFASLSDRALLAGAGDIERASRAFSELWRVTDFAERTLS